MFRQYQYLCLLALTGLAFLLTGCTITERMWERKNEYKESVSSVLISQDGKKLVFIGKDYHYIFDAPEQLVKTVQGSFRDHVAVRLGHFSVDDDGKVYGQGQLTLRDDASEADRSAAMNAGYQLLSSRPGLVLSKERKAAIRAGDKLLPEEGAPIALITLNGIRYSSGGLEMPASITKLNKTYEVEVTAEQSLAQKTGNVLLTPITVAADGVVAIALTPLVAFTLTACYLNPCFVH